MLSQNVVFIPVCIRTPLVGPADFNLSMGMTNKENFDGSSSRPGISTV